MLRKERWMILLMLTLAVGAGLMSVVSPKANVASDFSYGDYVWKLKPFAPK